MLYLINPQKYIKKNKEQLWEEDHKTFYWWIGALFVSLLIIITILITMLVIFIADKDIILKQQVEWIMQSPNNNNGSSIEQVTKKVEAFINGEIAWQVIFIAVFLCALGLLTYSFWKCLKSKTFSVLSSLPTGIVFFLSFSSFLNFITLIGQSISDFLSLSNYYIFNFIVIKIIYLLVWFFVSRNVAIIRRLFVRLENIEKFESVIGKKIYEDVTGDNSQSNPAATTSKATSNVKKEDDPIYQRLSSLEEKGLHQIAKELSISGYDSMDKAELLNTIHSIYKNVQKPEKNDEIEVETINDEKIKDDEIKDN